MNLATAKVHQHLTTTTCITCGMIFAIPEGWKQEKKLDHTTFYCPNGHRMHYPGKSDVETLQEEKEYLERRLVFSQNNAAVAERQRAAAKGQVTKIKNRIKAGVCPFCNRQFKNLKNHMESKHSDDSE